MRPTYHGFDRHLSRLQFCKRGMGTTPDNTAQSVTSIPLTHALHLDDESGSGWFLSASWKGLHMIPGQARSSKQHEAEFKVVNDQLDATTSAHPDHCRRQNPRLRYRRSFISVQIVQRTGSLTPVAMASRDLSATGMCLLHAGFLHTGTNCIVTLKKRLGGEDRIAAMVVRCRHAGGIVHSLRVKFDKPIWVKHYLDPEECKGLTATAQTDPSLLHGTVLMLDDQPVDRSLMAFHLKKTKCVFVPCATSSETVEAVTSKRPDVILCDLNLGTEKGELAIAAIRKQGYRGQIVVMSAESDATRIKAALTAGANEVFAKPYDAPRLYSNLAGWLKSAGSGVDQQLIYSTLADVTEMGELLEQYLAQVIATADQLRKQTAAGNVATARLLCQNLMGSGEGYGFGVLSEAARDALTALDATQSIAESQTELHLVDAIARRLSLGKPTVAPVKPRLSA